MLRKLFGVMNHYFEVQPIPAPGGGQAEDAQEGEEEECMEEDEELSEIEGRRLWAAVCPSGRIVGLGR